MTAQPFHGFWSNVPKPILGLSPMDGVSDHPFRHIQKKYGQPAVMYTEFSSVEGITHGSRAFFSEFCYEETQRPVIAQLFGIDPQSFYEATTVVCALGFDGVDINMGCPAKNVAHRGAGAGLIRNPQLATKIIVAVKKAVTDWSEGQTLEKGAPSLKSSIRAIVEQKHQVLPAQFREPRLVPVSIKTRIGYDQDQISEWIPVLLEQKPATIAIHGRTLQQQYGGKADWEAIGNAAALAHGSGTLILGNGDISAYQDAIEKTATYGLDGVLIGRASFGNPYIFKENPPDVSPTELAKMAYEHSLFFEKYMKSNPKSSFTPMRKHLGWYIRGIERATEIRIKLFQTASAQEVRLVLEQAGLLK